MSIEPGDVAPDFTATADDGRQVSLRDFRGRPVVLYFYPRADTPGCTTESCGIRDEFSGFQGAGVEVIGVSPDTVEAQAAFKAKYGLPFTLLADPEHELAERYGVWQLKQSQGREFMGVVRNTFIIGPDGSVQQTFRQVDPTGHARELLEVLAQSA